MNVRARLASQSAAYRALTDYERLAWGSLGALMSRTDRLGQPYTLTGAQANVSVNSILAAYGQATVTAAPILTTPDAPADVVITATGPGAALTVAVATEPATGFLGFYAVPPQTSGRTFSPAPRLIATNAVGGSPYNILTAWQNRFGTLTTGQKVTIEVRAMQDGFESIGAAASTIVA